jgi:hypothetical protein
MGSYDILEVHDGWLARYLPELLSAIYSIKGTISDLPAC